MRETKTLQEQNSRTLKSTLGGYFALGVVFALLMPDELAASLPGLDFMSKVFEAAVPGISRISDVSPFPSTMRLFLVVMWLGLPFAVFRVYRAWALNPRLSELRKGDQWFVAGAIWFIALIPALFLYLFFDVTRAEILNAGGRGGWMLSLMTQYRLGAALIGSVCFCIAAACSGIALRLTLNAASRSETNSRRNGVRED